MISLVRRWAPVTFVGLLFCALVRAATPPSGTLGPTNGAVIEWDFASVGPGVSSGGTVESLCAPVYCDGFELTIALPQPDADFYTNHIAKLTITYTWTSALPTDLDLFVFAPDGTESGPGTPDNTSTGPGIEVLTVSNPSSGIFRVESHVGITPAPTPAHAKAVLTYQTVAIPPPPVLGARAPHFADASPPIGYQTKDVIGRPNAGEPSVGLDWIRNAAMYMAASQISRVTFDDILSPPTASWQDVTPLQLAIVSEDSILFTDRSTARTVASELLVVGSNNGFSDNAGTTWSPGTFPVPHAPDHQTVGGGPYASPMPLTAGLTGYPNAIYYCSQDIIQPGGALCARSDTGGVTFNPSVRIFGAGTPCGAIHGHVKVGPEGHVYLPQNNCTRPDGIQGQGMAVSADNGQTWTYSVPPDSVAKPVNAGTDPSVGVGSLGTVYYGYEDGSGHPKISVSHDSGQTWSASFDAGASLGIQNSKFPMVVAGDDNRAAFAFLGTTSAGNDQSSTFAGVWYLYVSYTFDGGQHWTTISATPGDPVQRGCIWNGGGNNACRNLLDFNDIGIDQIGRVLTAYTDGCANIDFSYSSLVGGIEGAVHGPSQCDSNPNSYADTDKVSLAALARQSCGQGLFSNTDPGFTNWCPPPRVVSTSPAASATGVLTSSGVGASFDELVDQASIQVVDSQGHVVKGTSTCLAPCASVLFIPSPRLRKGVTYTASVSASNVNGIATRTWSFTTAN